MSDITRNTFDKTKNYAQVVHQKGRVLVDNEFNEQAMLGLSQTSELGADCATAGSIRATQDVSLYRPATSDGTGWVVYASGTAEMHVSPGDIWVDGYQLTLGATLDLTAVGLTFPVVGGAGIYGFIYCEAVLTEVDDVTDPNLGTPQIGQTTVRQKMEVTFYQAEGTTSFDATFAAIPALPVAVGPRVWGGNKVRFFLARYYRPAAAATVAFADVFPLLNPTPGAAYATTHRFIKTIRNLSGDGADSLSDGAVMWSLAAGKLQIGKFHAGTSAQKRKAGALLRVAGDGYDHTFTNHSAATPTAPDLTNSWTIPEGSALGYSSLTSCISHVVAMTTASYAHDTTPVLAAPTSEEKLHVSRLVVQALEDFKGNPTEFVVCHREGNDLIWYNGQVTRGEAGTNNFVFPDIGDHPSEWKAIIATQGAGNLTGADALQRAMNHSTHAAGAGAILTAAEKRNMRFFLKAGSYTFAGAASDTPYKYGTTIGAYTGHIFLQGDGNRGTTITVDAPATTGARDATTNRASLHLYGQSVTLKDLKFSHAYPNGGPSSAILQIRAEEVTIENCIFDSPVIIQANRVIVDGCIFNASGWLSTSDAGKRMFHARVWAGAGHLELAPFGVSAHSRFKITGNYFLCGDNFGVSSSVKLMDDCTALGGGQDTEAVFELSGNLWSYATGATEQWSQYPAIAIGDDCRTATVRVFNNRFYGHTGCSKLGGRGTGGAADERFPWPTAGYRYRASLLEDWANNADATDTASTDGTRVTACAYISVTGNRLRRSLLEVTSNVFDMSFVGTNLASTTTHLYSVLGAMVVSQDNTTAGAATKQVNNIRFMRNTIDMVNSVEAYANDTTTGGIPFVFGFYAAPGWSTCAGDQAIRYRSFHVSHNQFSWREPDGDNSTWRSYLASDPVAVASTLNRMFDTPCMVGIVMKNGTFGAAVTNDYRTGSDIVIDCNSMSEEEQSGTGQYLYEQITLLGIATAPHSVANFITVDGGFAPYTAFTLDEVSGAVPQPDGAGIYGPRVIGNSIIGNVFKGATDVASFGIMLSATWAGQVYGNTCLFSEVTAAKLMEGILVGSGSRNHVASNIVLGYAGIVTSANDYASGNVALDCNTSSISGGGTYTFTTTSNFD